MLFSTAVPVSQLAVSVHITFLDVVTDVEAKQQRNYSNSLLYKQVDQLTSELSTERSNAQKIDAERASLDRQNKDLKAKLAELDAQLKSNKKLAVQALEIKIANLEDQLEVENR